MPGLEEQIKGGDILDMSQEIPTKYEEDEEDIEEVKGLEEQVKVVAKARRFAVEATERRQAEYQEWQEANQTFFDSETKAKTVCQEAEALLRELILKAYAKTGIKNVANGVGVREVTKLDYDAKEAYSWALQHSLALKLDTQAFEKIAKTTTIDFVKITTEAQATIATNLEEK